MPSPSPNLRELVGECLDLPEAERAAFLVKALGPDAGLQARAIRLLRAHQRAHNSGFLERATASDALAYMSTRVLDSTGLSAMDLVGSRIGRYTVCSLIGTGGMGSVFEATQDNPRRTVALKIMRLGLLSPSALRRFEYESQVLARLRHPGIAQVYEAGTHVPETGPLTARAGVPFFAMELVPQARSITDFARDLGLDVRARVELMVRVCDAVQHAHQRGIIHRDLKPSNILVDACGQPKIIDFGVARVDGEDSAVATMQTRDGQLIGTLQYMSPEQCGPTASDVDTRSDVYSLGVVLYELLTGRPPYDLNRLGVLEATRVIRERIPARLSGVDTALRGDIETIVLKTLEKDRERRYATVAELQSDLHRFLAGERISARPASVVYQMQVFARRNKAAVVGAACVALAVVLGLIVSSVGFIRATHARDEAWIAQLQARDEARRANRIADFLKATVASAAPNSTSVRPAIDIDPFEDPDTPTSLPGISRADRLSVPQLLEGAGSQLESAFSDDPLTRAELATSIGATLYEFGRFNEAEPLLRSALAAREKFLGKREDRTIRTRRLLAHTYLNRGDPHDALPLYEENFKAREPQLASQDAPAITVGRDYAYALRFVGKINESLALQRRMRALAADRLGERHIVTLRFDTDIAGTYWSMGKRDEAIALARSNLASLREVASPDSPAVVTALYQVGAYLSSAGPLEEGEAALREVIDITRKRYSDSPARALWYEVELLYNLRRQRKYEPAAVIAARVYESTRAIFGADSHRTIRARASLARTIMYIPGRENEAERHARAAADDAMTALTPTDANAWAYRAVHAETVRRNKRPEEAEMVLRMLRDTIAQAGDGEEGEIQLMISQFMGAALLDQGRLDEAQAELLDAWDMVQRFAPPQSEHRRETAELLARLYAQLNEEELSKQWQERAQAPATPGA